MKNATAIPAEATACARHMPYAAAPDALADRTRTALREQLAAIGQGWRAPLAAYVDEVQQHFASQVAALGGRAIAEPLEARRAELARLLADMKRQELPDMPLATPLVVHIAVSLR